MAKKNIFPIYIDADAEAVAGSGSWSGLTSRIDMNGSFTLSKPSGVDVEPGTLVSVKNDTGGNLTLTISPDPFGDDELDEIVLGDNVTQTLMFIDETVGFLVLGTTSAS
jgi:hypothetical protein